MWLKSINLKNVYNFGELGTPELSALKQFNLFIGKNGSGKTNVFRAICNLDVKPFYSKIYNKFSYLLWNESRRWTNIPNTLEKDSRKSCDIQLKLDNIEIEFKDGYHVKGDFKMYSGSLISIDNSELSFKEKLHDIKRSNVWPAILSFSLTYIFQLDFSFSAGEITEFFTKQGNAPRGTDGKPVLRFSHWSSGFLSVSNLLIEVLRAEKRIVCIDEPEVHLEPRILRRVIDILIWISIRGNETKCDLSQALFSDLEEEWKHWFDNSNLKDSAEWKNIDGLKHFKPRQIFISSHSSVLINEFIKFPELCAIYEFDRTFQDSSYVADFGKTSKEVKQQSVIAEVRKVGMYPHSVLDNLGAHGADILQANGVIWVEGPSDVIYIKKWIELYSNENTLQIPTQGIDYEFQMYGGTLLDSLCFIKGGHSEEDELKKLVSMFSFSRNSFVVTDSDAIVNNIGVIVDQSKFKNAKEFIAKEFDKLTKNGYRLGLWYKKLDTEIRTLEDYLDDETLKSFGTQKESKLTKKIYAQKITESWDDSKLTSDFKHLLRDEIKILYDNITEWNK